MACGSVFGVIVTCLVAKLTQMAREQYRAAIARMQVIDEMNHHIRNALAPIALAVDVIENEHLIRIISDWVYRIDWAFRQILPDNPFLKEKGPAAYPFLATALKSQGATKETRETAARANRT